jgi:hypothetical protein
MNFLILYLICLGAYYRVCAISVYTLICTLLVPVKVLPENPDIVSVCFPHFLLLLFRYI